MRDFVDEIGVQYSPLRVSPEQWKSMEIIERVLREPYQITIALQKAEYFLSDFFGDWLKMKHNLGEIDHDFARLVLDCLIKREKPILEHKFMLSAVYLDPRYNFLLTEEQKNIAESNLIFLWSFMNQICPQQMNIEQSNDNSDNFSKFLREKSNNFHPDIISPFDNIIVKVKSFLNRPSINYKTNVFEYWTNIKKEEPELFKLITVLFSIPVTQASVERCFSSLSYIFNNYRARLTPGILKEVLILRLNFELFK